MISETIRKIIDKEVIEDDERQELIDWFSTSKNTPDLLNTVFSGASRISALSQITPNMGIMVAGKFISPDPAATSQIPTDTGYTGSFMSGGGENFSDVIYNIGGVSAGTLQWGASQTDGKLYAGAGAVILSSSGIAATAGTIGGWVISSTAIKDAAGMVGISSAVTGADDIRFFAGHTTPSSAPFRVDENGVLVATSATITGSITAYSGSIGGWILGTDSIVDASGTVGMSSAITGGDDVRFWAGDATPGNGLFRVYESGILYAGNANISGTIEASSGTIGGWSINTSDLSATSIVLDSGNNRIRVGNLSTNYIEIDGANERIRSSNFVSGVAGFNIATTTGDAEFNNIVARGELKTFLLTSSNQMAVAGNILVSKDAGKLGADVTSGTTTIDFGKALTVGNWIKIQGPDSAGASALEWVLVGSLVSGTTYNVTRNVDGSGSNGWLKDTPFVVIGASGDSRIELVAGATASIQLITQGATWNTQTVQASMSTAAGAITAGGGNVLIDSNGIYVANNQQGNFGFKDTSGNRNNLFIYSDNEDALGIINKIAGKAIRASVVLTDTTTPYLKLWEKTGEANTLWLQVNAGVSPTEIAVANDIFLRTNLSGKETVFNERGNDIDFRIESDNVSNAFRVDAGNDRIEIGADHYIPTRGASNNRVYFNEANQDMDFSIEGTTDNSLFYVDAGLNGIGIGGAAVSGKKLAITGNFKVTGTIEGINGGWCEVSDSWSYASASTITIPSDGTTTYEKGMKLRWKQGGGYKYGHIASLTATVITIIVNTDYTVANSAITDIAYSLDEKPFGFPAELNWSPTHSRSGTNYTNAPTTNTAAYKCTGTKISWREQHTMHATPGGTGYQKFTLPVTPASRSTGNGMNLSNAYGLVTFIETSEGARLFKYDGTSEAVASNIYFANGEYEF